MSQSYPSESDDSLLSQPTGPPNQDGQQSTTCSSSASHALSPSLASPPSRPTNFSRQNHRLHLRNARLRATPLYLQDCARVIEEPFEGARGHYHLDTINSSAKSHSRRPLPHTSFSSLGPVKEVDDQIQSSLQSDSATEPSTLTPFEIDDYIFSTSDGSDETDMPQSKARSPSTAATAICDRSISPRTPISKNRKSRQKPLGGSRSPSWEVSKYIEHLESQLLLTQAQLRLLTSPTNSSSQSNKLRTLQSECRRLRIEVSEWVERFDERMQDGLRERILVESGLKARIRILEREANMKVMGVKEIERDLEEMTKRAKHVDALEAENVALEKRLDFLTELLAQSPTKNTLGHVASIQATDRQPLRSRRRPQPLVTRMASSPDGLSRQVLPNAIPLALRRHHSVHSTADGPSDALRARSNSELETSQECPSGRSSPSIQSESLFSPISASAPTDASSMPRSRPTSWISEGSSAGDPPVAPQTDNTGKPSQRRFLRRFRAGSHGPKALILPSASNSVPHSMTSSSMVDSSRNSDTTKPRSRRGILGADSSYHDDATGLVDCSGTPFPILGGTMADWKTSARAKPMSDDGDETIDDSQPDTDFSLDQNVRLRRRPQRLFSELVLATGRGTLSTNATSDGASSRDISLRSQRGLCGEKAILSRQAFWFGISRSRQPPPFAMTFEEIIMAFRALFVDVWRNPVKLAWRLLLASGSPTTYTKAMGGLGWCLLGLMLGPSGQSSKRRTRRIEQGKKRVLNSGIVMHDTMEPGQGQSLEQSNGGQGPTAMTSQNNRNMPNALEDDGIDDHTSMALTVLPAEPKYGMTPGSSHLSRSNHLWMWIKFSVALALTVGVALRDGPDSMFAEDEVEDYQDYEDELEPVDRSEQTTDDADVEGLAYGQTESEMIWGHRFWHGYL